MKTILFAVLIALLFVSNLHAAGSQVQTPAVSKDVKAYNQGVQLMLDKKFAKAEKQFRKALQYNQRFAEAHNNLAYTLRKQGENHFQEALAHYNQAIELKPSSPEPYMYRGVLHMQMGNKELALEDHQTLLEMGSKLAGELEYVIKEGREKEPESFFGVSQQIT